MIGIFHYIGQASASLWASLVNIYDIPIARVMAIGGVLLAILISFANQNLLLGISLYRYARSEHVSQELHKKAHDTLVIAAAYFGGAIYVAILIWSIVTGTSYIVLAIGVCICTIVILIKFISKRPEHMQISDDRIRHMLAVAKKMEQVVSENPNRFDASPEDAFVLGLLHDIGYEFVDEQKNHAKTGGLILKSQGYKYWREVYYHGIPYPDYASKLLTLLNQVDLTTGPTGEYITVKERLKDIRNRYGKDSWQLQDAMRLADSLPALSNAQDRK